MCPSIDVVAIVQDEEEIIHFLLTSCMTLHPFLRSVIIVDGGSQDRTIDIINSWRDRLPIDLVGHPFDNFCSQLNRALDRARADFIFKADADLTWGTNMRDEILAQQYDPATFFDCRCFFSVIDAYHYTSSNRCGYATTFWKNVGARYVRPIHSYPVWPGEENPPDRMAMVRGDWESIRIKGRLKILNTAFIFDNSLRKSDEALRRRARRYARWAELSAQAGIPLPVGDDEWCVRNRQKVLDENLYGPLPDHVAQLVIQGT